MEAGSLLDALPGEAFAFALVLARCGCVCMLLPGIGEAELPATIRAGFAVALSLLLLPVVAPLVAARTAALPAGPVGVGAAVGAEVATGLWLGWLARLLVLALPMAGQVVANLAGWSNVLQPDALMGGQASALSRALGLAAPVALLASGLHALPLAALAGSYRLIPPGALLPAADGAEQVLAALGACFALLLRLAAPFVLAGTLWQAALGLLARLVPQLQLTFAGVPGQIVGGLVLLSALAAPMLASWLGALRGGLALLPGG